MRISFSVMPVATLFFCSMLIVILPGYVLPLKDQRSAANSSYHLSHGTWVVHRGHGTSKWLSYLPDSFSSSGQAELYLFEKSDLCRCARGSGSARGLDIVFLGGDPTRHVQLSLHQLFTDQPYEVRETPTECDSIYSSIDSPCGQIVKNPLADSFCNNSLNVFSINFDRNSKPFSVLDIVYSKANESFHRKFDTVYIIDPQRFGINHVNEYSEIFSNISASFPTGFRFLTLLHNTQSPDDEAVESSLLRFLSLNISFLNFHGIMAKYSEQYTKQMVHDVNAYKNLFFQMVLNTICEIYPEQSMLYGLKVGSFMLKEKRYYEEGSLLRPGNSREIFLLRNGSVHAFPNWDTFVAGGYEGKAVRPIPPVEWADIPVGSPIDPCTKC